MPQSLIRNYIHITFSTKRREQLILPGIEEALFHHHAWHPYHQAHRCLGHGDQEGDGEVGVWREGYSGRLFVNP